MRIRAVALLVVTVAAVITASRVVVIVFHLAVSTAIVVITGGRVEGCMLVGAGLSYGRQCIRQKIQCPDALYVSETSQCSEHNKVR